jgi:hypothetical protein
MRSSISRGLQPSLARNNNKNASHFFIFLVIEILLSINIGGDSTVQHRGYLQELASRNPSHPTRSKRSFCKKKSTKSKNKFGIVKKSVTSPTN